VFVAAATLSSLPSLVACGARSQRQDQSAGLPHEPPFAFGPCADGSPEPCLQLQTGIDYGSYVAVSAGEAGLVIGGEARIGSPDAPTFGFVAQ
jgi:hypothetical protein